MHQQKGNTCLIGKVFQLTNDFIVIGIAKLITASFSDFLQSINDKQSGVRMLRHEAVKLFVKPCTELFGASCEVEGISTLYSEHTGQTLLQSPVVILQSKV